MTVIVPGSYPAPTSFTSDAFADFLDLRTAVIELVSDASIADVFPRFVAIAESRLNRTLRMREQITSGIVTLTAGRAPLPEDFAEMIGIYSAGGGEYLQQSVHHKDGYVYSIQGSEIVSPLISGDVAVDYYAVIPPLGDSITTSNWLLARYPDVYLYSVGFEAAKYMRQAELAAALKGLMEDAIETARADDARARYARARVRVAGICP